MDLNFLNGIYYVKTENMLKEDDFNTLKRLGRPLFFKYLKTKDYGFNSGYLTIDNIIEKELLNTKIELDLTARNNLITDVFYVDNDLTNMKIVYKEIHEGIKSNNFTELSRFEKEALEQFFKYGNLKVLPSEHKELFKSINKIPRDLKLQNYLQELEKVTYNYYTKLTKSKKGYHVLFKYLELKKVINNLLTFIKFKNRDESLEKLKDALLEESIVGIEEFSLMYLNSNNDILNKLLIYFPNHLTEAIHDYIKTLDTEELDLSISLYLTDEIKSLSYNSDTLGPILYYLHLKELEALRVREFYYED